MLVALKVTLFVIALIVIEQTGGSFGAVTFLWISAVYYMWSRKVDDILTSLLAIGYPIILLIGLLTS